MNLENKLIIYQAPNGAIQLRGDADHDTIWASQKQMAEIFGVWSQAITKHISNIYQQEELIQEATCSKMEQVQIEWTRTTTRQVKHYNLEVLISVGYRINSLTGTKFRQRATQTLKQHITEWYTINPHRIQHNYEQFLKAIEDIKLLGNQSSNIQKDDIIELIKTFAGTWFTLDAYDKSAIPSSDLTIETLEIEADKLYHDVSLLKQDLISKWEASDLFAQEKYSWSLQWILRSIFQTVFSEDAYPSIESKAAHLLYFIIKNHPFNDGNKRTWAFAFIRLLRKADYPFESKITPQALTALALLIAESNPKDKDKIVTLVMLLLQ